MRTVPLPTAVLLALFTFACAANTGGDGPERDIAVDEADDLEPERTTIAITQPEEGALVATRYVRITGTTNAESVTVSGEVVEVVGGAFETAIEFPDGPATVEASSGDARDSVSFTVDGSAPIVEITSPIPGSFIVGDTIDLEGRVTDDNLESVEVAGEPVSVDEEGLFTWSATVAPGAHRVRVAAADGSGHVGYGFTTALVGQYVEPGATIGRAAVLQVGTEALGTIGDAVEPLITPAAIEPRIHAENPLMSGFWGHLDAEEYRHGPVRVEVRPGARTLTVVVTIDDVALDFRTDLRIGPDITGVATASSAVATVVTEIGASDGRPTVTLLSTDVTLNDLLIDVRGLWSWLDRNVVTRVLRGQITGRLNDLAAERVPPALDSALERIRTTQVVRVLGQSALVRGEMRSFVASATGLRGTLDLGVSAFREDMAMLSRGPGSLLLDVGYPNTSPTPDLRASVSLDLLNQVLYAGWTTGALEVEVVQPVLGESGPLTAGAVQLLAPGLRGAAPPESPVTLVATPNLPPVVQPGSDGALLEAFISDLRVTAIATVEGAPVELFTLSAAIRAPVRISVTDDEIGVDVMGWELEADVVGEPVGFPEGPELDNFLTSLLGPLAEDFTSIDGLDVPQLNGFSASDLRVDLDRGYLVAEGRLRYTP